MHILIIGTGYVGLVTGACFAHKGHHVTCLDIDEKKISSLQQGIIPFYEPDLEELVRKNMDQNRLNFITSYKEGISSSDIIFICTPTPSKEDGSCDLSYVISAAREIAIHIDHPVTIAIKSTVAPKSSLMIEKVIQETLDERCKTTPFDVISAPEFLREGSAVSDSLNPERVIVGLEKNNLKELIFALYQGFHLRSDQLIFMDRISAELTKYAANAHLATRISFMNEMAAICEKIGASIESIREGIGSDKRIGPEFLYAGIGYGGSCFPKDIRALRALAKEYHEPTLLLDAVESINEQQKKLLVKKISRYFLDKGGLNGRTIAIWGLSFKPNTDDIREAPSLSLIQELQRHGAQIHLYDPVAISHVEALYKGDSSVKFFEDEYEASKNAEAIALVTEWKQFLEVDFTKLKPLMKRAAFFDGRNQYQPQMMHSFGFDYFPVGIANPS